MANPRRHGVTSETHTHMLLDSGQINLNYVSPSSLGTIIGATRSGSSFTIEQDIRDMGVDGAKGSVKGYRRIVKSTAKLVCKFIEFKKEIIQMALPGAAITDEPLITPTHDKIARSLQISLTDYKSNVAFIGEILGSRRPVIIVLSNVLVEGNFELSSVDGDESVVTLAFSAHFSPSDLQTEPWSILIPNDVTTTP